MGGAWHADIFAAMNTTTTHNDILRDAQQVWSLMSQFRRERQRAKQYTYGEQWGETVMVDGVAMTERDYLAQEGGVALTNNLIRRLVRNIVGVWRSQWTPPICYAREHGSSLVSEMMTAVLHANMQLNRLTELYARSMEEFLISGMVVHRKSFGHRQNITDCWTDFVLPTHFFVDTRMRDFRAWDIDIIGQIHDVAPHHLMQQLASSAADCQRLSEIYSLARNQLYLQESSERFGVGQGGDIDFLLPGSESACRVIEVWRREAEAHYKCHDPLTGEVFRIALDHYPAMVEGPNRHRAKAERINAQWTTELVWHYYFLSPLGHVLSSGPSPYAHGSHPYVVKAYPYIDGEIHSFVSDIIDQQRYANRLITLYDWIIRSSAKGLLLFPEEALPEGFSLEDIAREWSRYNGIVVYKDRPGAKAPQQVANNCTNIGIQELLSLQIKLMEDISGVNGALQGKPGYAGISAALYDQQTRNAMVSLLDILDSFASFTLDCAYKDVCNMQQYYRRPRVVRCGSERPLLDYDPELVSGVALDVCFPSPPVQ